MCFFKNIYKSLHHSYQVKKRRRLLLLFVQKFFGKKLIVINDDLHEAGEVSHEDSSTIPEFSFILTFDKSL